MAVLVLQHVAPEGPGRVGAALERARHRVDLRRLHLGDPVPRDATGHTAVVVMGGPMGVRDADHVPHLRDELRLLEDALGRAVPVLGVCLGAQLLATAAGGSVKPGRALELGWLPVTLTEAARDDPVLGPAGPSLVPLHWHGDVIGLPPGATHLARSAAAVVQAFRVGAVAYGLLFHLEADRAHVTAMAEAFPADVAAAGLTADALAGDSAVAALAPVADGILDAWVTLIPPT